MTKVSSGAVRRVVFISTYPPRYCGIATFTQDLLKNIGLLQPGLELAVYALNRSRLDSHAYPDEVTDLIDQDNPDSYRKAAASINKRAAETLVIIQHEYGIHGGEQGKHLLQLLKNLKCPIITTLHTVLDHPSPQMKSVTKAIVNYSERVVLLTNNSLELIKRLYPGSEEKLVRIPHGIHPIIYAPSRELKQRLKLANRQVLLTFGLLGRNKGIEYVIKSLPSVVRQFPDVIYLIVGGTHPDVLRSEGEAYRKELIQTVKKLSLQDHVLFINNYMPLDVLLSYLQVTDIYIASSLNPEQVVSGTLSYALGAGCAVVSTEFSQAREVISDEIGRVVPIKKPEAMCGAIIELLTDSQELSTMKRAAYYSTRSMLWTNVADNYLTLLANVSKTRNYTLSIMPEFKLNHLEAMSSKFGIAQFASGAKPALRHGYTLDDNSRALQFGNEVMATHPALKKRSRRLNKKYLTGIGLCLSQKPIANYLSRAGRPTSQNLRENLDDSLGRAYLALQASVVNAEPELKPQVTQLLSQFPPPPPRSSLRTTAFYLMGVSFAYSSGEKKLEKNVLKLADVLVDAYYSNSSSGWNWFEPTMTYANGSLCASLLDAASSTSSAKYQLVGLESLGFLIKTCFIGEVYVPIGQDGWYGRRKKRAMFDQQPEDVFATIQALLRAYQLTSNQKYKNHAMKAFSWFLGNNLLGARVYDDLSGGCHDGLTPQGINPDEGAESSVAYLRSRLLMDQFGAKLEVKN